MRGCDVALLSRDEAVGLEPALASMDGGFRGAIYGASDELGDARHFTHALFRWLVDNTPLDARFHTEAIALETDRRGFRGVRSAAGTIPGDAIVLCLGACESRSLLPAVRGPMLPARGYSVTLPRGASAPSVSITDLDNRILFSPLAERLRVTGFADFVGFTRHRDTARIATLRQVARRVALLPQSPGSDATSLLDHDTAEAVIEHRVVLGTHGHSGLRRALIGSVASAVARSAPVPVLLVPPLPG